jgi:hypothetical protein
VCAPACNTRSRCGGRIADGAQNCRRALGGADAGRGVEAPLADPRPELFAVRVDAAPPRLPRAGRRALPRGEREGRCEQPRPRPDGAQ